MQLIVPSKCSICGSSVGPGSAAAKVHGQFDVLFCQTCGVGHTLLNPDQLAERKRANEVFYNVISRLEIYFTRKTEFYRRYGQLLSLLSPYGPFDRVLDVGCNIGFWLYFLKEKGVNTLVGIEENAECCRIAREVFGLQCFKSLGEIDKEFDLISLQDVLEHVDDPYSFMKTLSTLGHKETVYLIQLPNHKSSMAKWLGAKWPWWSVPDHRYHFCPGSLNTLLARAGLAVLSIYTCETVYDWIAHVAPSLLRPILRPLLHYRRTSGYIYRSNEQGSLIQVIAKPL